MKRLIPLFVSLFFVTIVLVAGGCSKEEPAAPAKPAAEAAKPAEPEKKAEEVKPAEPEKKAEEAKPSEAKPAETAPEKK